MCRSGARTNVGPITDRQKRRIMSAHDLITAFERRVDRIRASGWSACLAAGAIMLALIAAAALGPSAAVAGSRIHVTLVVQEPSAYRRQEMVYSVTVTSASGQRLSGTETTQYLYGGEVVGTEKPANVHFSNGYYHDTLISDRMRRASADTAGGRPHQGWDRLGLVVDQGQEVSARPRADEDVCRID